MCPTGYLIKVDKTGCDPCPDNCAECERVGTDSYRCLRCDYRYALRESDTACLECSPGCHMCRHTSGEETLCDQCFEEWTMTSVETCLECPSNCVECDEATDGSAVCRQCREAYFLKTDKTCKRCPNFCQQCNDNGEGVGQCSKCYDGYLVNNENPTATCLSCPSTCTSCIGEARTGSIAKCDSCHDAWALDNDECVSCDANCVDCQTSTFCDECQLRYRMDSGSCLACSDNCLECSVVESLEQCDECAEGYVSKDENTCDTCGSHCIQCNLGGFCTVCDAEWEPDNTGNCQKCPSNCLDCTYSTTDSKTKCRTNWCKAGYAVNPDSGECEPCPDNCQTSSCRWNTAIDEPVCDACNNTLSNYVLNTDRTVCEDCPDDCATCTWNSTDAGRSVCTQCNEYFELRDEGCEPCPENCKRCTYNETSEAYDCDSENDCDTGYRLGEDMGTAGNGGNDICVVCSVENCERCNATDACTICTSPMMRSSSGSECRACPDHCTACHWNGDESETLCNNDAACESGFGLSTDDKCPACRGHCLTCPMKGDGTNPCKSNGCENEYTDDDAGDCKSCPGKCHECSYSKTDSRTKCKSGRCYNRYALINVGNSDGNCAGCPDNCAVCEWQDDGQGDARTWCTACDAEFDLKSSDGTCVACPEFCSACTYNPDTDSTECSSNDDCYNGYGITDTFQCEECPYNCRDCSLNEETGVLQCDQCNNYYVSNDQTCGACPGHCKVCSHNTGNIDCTTCDDGYALYQGSCLACPSNCLECSANSAGVTECRENRCKVGYGRDSTKKCKACSAMFENCARCSDANGVDELGQDRADCDMCFSAYTLADDRTSCKETFPGVCDMFEDRDYVCADGACDEGYTQMKNGSCSSMCYKCGDTMNNQLLDWETCYNTWKQGLKEENATLEQELCLQDCWVIAEKGEGEKEFRIARGCGIPYEDMDTLGITLETENKCKGGQTCKNIEKNGQKVKRCWKCCQGDRCNDFQAGSSAIQACVALLGAAILALYM